MDQIYIVLQTFRKAGCESETLVRYAGEDKQHALQRFLDHVAVFRKTQDFSVCVEVPDAAFFERGTQRVEFRLAQLEPLCQSVGS